MRCLSWRRVQSSHVISRGPEGRVVSFTGNARRWRLLLQLWQRFRSFAAAQASPDCAAAFCCWPDRNAHCARFEAGLRSQHLSRLCRSSDIAIPVFCMQPPITSAVSASSCHWCHVYCKQIYAATYATSGCLPCRVSAAKLLEINNAVFDAMKASIGGHDGVSYNVLLTWEFLVYVPRSCESSGPAEVNALVSTTVRRW